MLHHLEPGVGNAVLEVLVSEDLRALAVGPGEDWGDHDEGLLLVGLMLVQWLSEDLNDLLSLVKISAADQVNDDLVGADDAFAEGLGLALAIEELDLLVGRGHSVHVLLDHCSIELVALLAGLQSSMVVTHLLEKGVADQTVHTRDEDTLAVWVRDLGARLVAALTWFWLLGLGIGSQLRGGAVSLGLTSVHLT